MSTNLLVPGQRVADAAYPPPAADLRAAGYVALGSYVSSPTGNPKNWTFARIDDCSRNGLGVLMFAEQSELTVMTGYSQANLALGHQAAAMCDTFGYPRDCPVWFAVDTGAAWPNIEPVEGAFTAYRETCPWPLGIYGGSPEINHVIGTHGLAEYGHIAAASSWSLGQRCDYAHMQQHPSEPFGATRIDRNDVLKATPVWFPGGAPPDPPGGDMPTVLTVTGLVTLLSPSSPGTHTHASWVDSEADRNYLLAVGIPEQIITPEQLGGIRPLNNVPANVRALMHRGGENLVIPDDSALTARVSAVEGSLTAVMPRLTSVEGLAATALATAQDADREADALTDRVARLEAGEGSDVVPEHVHEGPSTGGVRR